MLVAIYSPADVLDRYPILQPYVATLIDLLSYKEVLGSESSFPQVSKLYHSLMVWTIPCFALVSRWWMSARVGRDRDSLLFKQHLSTFNKAALISLTPFWVALIWFASMNHGGDVRLVPFGSSRVALGMLGLSIHFLVGAMISAIYFSFQRVLFDKGGKV